MKMKIKLTNIYLDKSRLCQKCSDSEYNSFSVSFIQFDSAFSEKILEILNIQ